MKSIHILGVPMDLGQLRRGVDMGPSALRYAGLQPQIEQLGHRVYDHGNISVPNPEEAVAAPGDRRLFAVGNVCQQIFEWGVAHQATADFSLFLGGDHSMSIGSIKAAAHQKPAETGVIWIDAHADFNTPESSPSGNIHGMPVAVVIGEGASTLIEVGEGVTVPRQNIVQIGVRDVDVAEKVRIHQTKLPIFTMRAVDEQGIATIAHKALTRLAHCTHIHISLDLDSLDPSVAPGVGTPVRGGLSYREAHLLCEILGDSGLVRSMDVVEVNPILDQGNLTAELAVELVTSVLGKRIL